jgi:hypothetical protein
MMSFQLHTILRQSAPATFDRLARAFDTPVAWIEALAGTHYGPRELTLHFPTGRTGRTEPLVTTGWEFYSDHLFVNYVDRAHVRFGFDHLNHGRIWSRLIATDYAAPHTLRVALGSLWPPRAHPYFARLNPAQVEARAGRLQVELDGRVVFAAPSEFYDAAPEGTWFGSDPNGFYGRRFTGDILANREARFRPPPEARPGPVEMDLILPPGAVGRSWPLIATGERGRGDLFSICEVRPGWVRFGYDDWGSPFNQSAEVPWADGETHSLRLRLPSLLAAGTGPVARALRESLVLEVDGKLAWTRRVFFSPAGPAQVFFGHNSIGASSAETRFDGGIARIEWPGMSPEVAATGPVRFHLELPGDAYGRSEPLVSTGVPGRADVVSVRYVDLAHVRFQLDHWGAAFFQSPPVAIDYARLHELEVRIPSLAGPPAGPDLQGELEVRLDGRTVWRQASSFYPAAPDSLALAINGAGASTCDPAFTGGIVSIGRGP